MALVSFTVPAYADNWYKSLLSKPKLSEFEPYLENSRHVQIPQWEHEDWYAEDWLAQSDGMTLISGFYQGDILRDQYMGKNDVPILVVGPNFYKLSGLDKRRITHIIDLTYGITSSKPNGSFILKDWHTRSSIGMYTQYGLRLH